MTYRVIIWGLGKCMEQMLGNKVSNEIEKGNIEVVAEIDQHNPRHVFSNLIIEPKEITKYNYDYVIITPVKFYSEIIEIALKVGVRRENIVYGQLFLNYDFDFCTYHDSGWLNDNIFNDRICVTDYSDDFRLFKSKRVTISLGRKSSIGLTKLETGGNPGLFCVKIGNFTNISWDGVFELGLNLDHDYNRVLNYGLSHLFEDFKIESEKSNNLSIGSDVWIGRNVVLKSGLKIGDGAVVASNSVVTKDVPAYALVGGNPAKVIKYRFSDDMIHDFLKIKWWNWSLDKIMSYRDLFERPEEFLRRATS